MTKHKLLMLFLLGLLIGCGAGWGYYVFVMTPNYDTVSNASRL
ncbi:hypothetical protein EFBL_3547 [Effusibacillus lacus]|uniref:Uncharacterized protein n=1 Tax=Effusibacillus lacus TaxID=1348429 RepID=A0A292YRP7_9BACL|nr:hypothetical protein EFBL_3547 [Effusibacillus lacus]